MRSNNPVFNRSPEFNGQNNAYGNQTYAGNGAAYPGYGAQDDPSQWGVGTPTQQQGTRERMTIDSVVQKSGISIGVVVLVAAAAWVLTGDVTQTDTQSTLMLLTMVGGIAAFGLSLVNSFKRSISPGLVLAFCVAEGLVIGAFSKYSAALFGSDVVVGAVVGTIAAFCGTLAAYRFFDIKVTSRMRKFTVAAMFGIVALSILDGVLMMFGNAIGFNGYGTLGLVMSIAGLVVAIFMLLMDFDFIERGVAAGLPEVESWRAAFGLTVTLVWIYMNILRILSILSQD